MQISDPIGDMLTRIRNGCQARKTDVSMPSSKMKAAVAEVMKNAGYVQESRVEGDKIKTLTVTLKYLEDKQRTPVIEGIKRLSKPSSRYYAGAEDIPGALGGLGLVIMSTSEGVMSDRAARKRNVGGEVLCAIW